MDLESLKNIDLKESGSSKGVEVQASSLEEALQIGASTLGTSIINLDYEVIQKGKPGFLGLGKKDFVLQVWKSGELDLSQLGKGDLSDERDEEELDLPRDGEVKIKIKKSGIFIKATPPQNGGREVDYKQAENLLYRRGVHHFQKGLIRKIVKNAEADWVKIGEWVPNPEYDSKLTISISSDEMNATVMMSAPIYSGRTLEPEEIINSLEAEGVKFGVNYDKIKEVADDEIVNIPVVVAEGSPPQNGKDAQIIYKFRTGLEGSPLLESENGKVDYKNLNRVQNVIAGQVLAEKQPPTRGKIGRTVTNRILEARDGRDIPLRSGKNTKMSEDGFKVFSQKDGQVFLTGGDITVREIYEVRGDLDYNVGNVDFVGSVIIHGNVKENFRIKAAGDIIIKGVSQRAELLAEGKIMCKGGIKGGKVKTEQSIYARYIDNADVSANLDVVAREEIINSQISAGGRVICLTGKGGIIGGKIICGQQIYAKKLGSESYIKTILEAGVDPNIKQRLDELETNKEDLDQKFQKLLGSIDMLEKERRDREAEGEEFSPRKLKVFQKMLKAKEVYAKQLSIMEHEIRKMSNYLLGLENKGSISSRLVSYPGVVLQIKNADYEIKQEYKSVTFRYSGGMIKPDKYDAPDLEKELKEKRGTRR